MYSGYLARIYLALEMYKSQVAVVACVKIAFATGCYLLLENLLRRNN